MSTDGRLRSPSLALALIGLLCACDQSATINSSAVPPLAETDRSGSNLDHGANSPASSDGTSSVAASAARQPGGADIRGSDLPGRAATYSPEPVSPSRSSIDIHGFVPDDATLRMQMRGDIDGDGVTDVLLVLQKKAQSETTPRNLTILRGIAGGTFNKIVDNSNAVLCLSCGGMMGDPLSGITINPGGFAIVFEGGSRELWSRRYAFVYSKGDDDWVLDRIDETMSDRLSGHHEDKQSSREQIGAVSIKTFDAAQMAQESNP